MPSHGGIDECSTNAWHRTAYLGCPISHTQSPSPFIGTPDCSRMRNNEYLAATS